jgi:hypothetical protein
MWTRIQEGDYSPDDIASMLLWASGSYREAKKALTRADEKLKSVAPKLLMVDKDGIASAKRHSDEAVYLAAYAIKKKLRCRDHTALKKLMGGRYRVYWDKLKARNQTLKQIAQLVQKPPKKS